MNDKPDRCSAGYEAQRLEALASYGILDTPPEPAYDQIVEVVSHICDTPIAVITFVEENRQWFKSIKGLDVRETPLDVSICAHAVRQSELFIVPDTTQDHRFAGNPLVSGDPHLRFYAGALLETPDGFPLGTLCVLDYEPRELNEGQRLALQALAKQVMAYLELMRAHREQAVLIKELEAARSELARQAFTDPLTGLFNRRAFEDRLSEEMALTNRGSAPASLLVIDLDHFKCINDLHGHGMGDEVLKRFAELCRDVFRPTDAIARWGGEEFIALMPRTTEEQASKAAQRLHQRLAQTSLLRDPAPALHVTVSIGICTLNAGCTLHERIHCADQLMYQAKQRGRNRTVSEGLDS